MATAALEQAKRAAAKMNRQLARQPGLRGVGVGVDPEAGFFVTVRIADDARAPKLPRQIDGVPVRLERRGLARALAAS